MHRECTNWRRPFAPADLARGESRDLEAERKAAGLAGLRFLSYHCPDCGADDLPRDDEFVDDFLARRAALDEAARKLQGGGVEVVVVAVGPP